MAFPKRLTLVLLCFVAVAGGSVLYAQDAAPSVIPSLQSWIDKYPDVSAAKDAFVNQNADETLEKLKAASGKHPQLPPAEVILGQLYAAANNQRGVLAALDTAAREHPTDPEAFLLLGNIAVGQSRNTEAKLLFEHAKQLLSEFKGDASRMKSMQARYYAGTASLSERFEKWDEAQSALEKWVQIDTKNSATYIRLARALFRQDQGKEAYKRLQTAAQLNDKLASPPIFIAQFYMEKEDRANAKQWLAHAEKHYDKHLRTRLTLAEWNWKEGNAAEAKKHADAAFQINQQDHTALIMAGMVAHFGRDFEVSEGLFKAAQRIKPKDFNTSNQLAMVLAAQNDPLKHQEALSVAEANVRDFPRSADAVATLAWVQLQLGKTEEAAKNMQAASRSGRGTPNMGYFIASFMDKAGKQPEAKKVLEQVMQNKGLFVYRPSAQELYAQLK